MSIDVKQILQDYVVYILLLFLGLILLAVKAYFQERGKLAALKSENKFLVDETEKIKSHYNKELEELKKEHQLDISRRKYIYESKKEEYLKFFRLLDTFSNRNRNSAQEKLVDILNEFNRNFLNANSQRNKKRENDASIVMSKKILKLSLEANEDYSKMKQETKTIRVVASDEIILKLNVLDLALQEAMDQSETMMKNLPKLMAVGNVKQIEKDQQNIEISGKVIIQITDKIVQLMRAELKEI